MKSGLIFNRKGAFTNYVNMFLAFFDHVNILCTLSKQK